MSKPLILTLVLTAASTLQAEIQVVGVYMHDGRQLLVLRDSKQNSQSKWLEIGATFEGYTLEGYDPARQVALLRSQDHKIEAKLVRPRATVSPVKIDDLRTIPDAELQSLGLYRIKAGDTLAMIARQSGVGIRDLAVWNQISDATSVKVGAILFVTPPVANKPPPSKPEN